jgi:putative addiction module CopG family antidote
MNFSVPSDLQSFVDQMVATGEYSTPDDVIREAMERLRDDRLRFEALKATFDEAVAELERGEDQPLDFAEIKRKVRELSAKNQAVAE